MHPKIEKKWPHSIVVTIASFSLSAGKKKNNSKIFNEKDRLIGNT
jgi:hypothetical protein